MIRSKTKTLPTRPKMDIVLTGGDGDKFTLISTAIDLSTKINRETGEMVCDTRSIVEDMINNNLQMAINTFDIQFGEFVDIYV